MGGQGQIGRVGLLSGLGAPVNNCQQCRKQPSWGAHLLLGGLAGGLGQGKYIFG